MEPTIPVHASTAAMDIMVFFVGVAMSERVIMAGRVIMTEYPTVIGPEIIVVGQIHS